MRAAVVGSRTYLGQHDVCRLVRVLVARHGEALVVVSGGAAGVDRWAEAEARRLCASVVVYAADWHPGGGPLRRGAGMARNTTIVENSDILYAFHHDRSRGTLDTIRKAVVRGIPCWVCTPSTTFTQGAAYLQDFV